MKLFYITIIIIITGCAASPEKLTITHLNKEIDYKLNANKPFESHQSANDYTLMFDAGDVSGQVDSVLATSDNKELISCSRDGTVRSFDISTGKELRKFLWNVTDETGRCTAIALDKKDKLLYVGVEGLNDLLVYNFNSQKLIKRILVGGIINDLDISSDNKYIALGLRKKVLVIDTKSGKVVKSEHEAVNSSAPYDAVDLTQVGAYKIKIIKREGEYLIIFVRGDDSLYISTLKGHGVLKVEAIYNRSTLTSTPELTILAYSQERDEIAVTGGASNRIYFFGIDSMYPINVDAKKDEYAYEHMYENSDSLRKLNDHIYPKNRKRSKYESNILKTQAGASIIGLSYSFGGKYLVIENSSWKNHDQICGEVYDEYDGLVASMEGSECERIAPFVISNNRRIGFNGSNHLVSWSFAITDASDQSKNIPLTSHEHFIPIKYSISFDGNFLAWGTKETSGINSLKLNHMMDLNTMKIYSNPKKFHHNKTKNSIMFVTFKPYNAVRKQLIFRLRLNSEPDITQSFLQVSPEEGWTSFTYAVTEDLIISGNRNGHLIGYDWSNHAVLARGVAVDFIGLTDTILSLSVHGSTLVATDRSGIISLWKIPSYKEIISYNEEYSKPIPVHSIFHFLTDNLGNYLITSNDGYFAGSRTLMDKVWLRKNAATNNKEAMSIKINQLYDSFYRPDIVLARLQRLNNIENIDGGTLNRALACPPPEISLLSVEKSSDDYMNVSYKVQSAGGGVGEIRFYINGKLANVENEAPNPMFSKEKIDQSLNSKDISQRLRGVKLVQKHQIKHRQICNSSTTVEKGVVRLRSAAGKNSIRLTAFNVLNNVQGLAKETSYISDRTLQKTKVYALVVGIDKYKNSEINLNYAVRDSESMKKLLSERLHNIYNH